MRDELWLKHDARSRLDPKMSLFLKCEGMLGYGVFWALIEVLHYQNEHEFDENIELGGIAAQLQVEELVLQNIISRLIQYGLFARENGKVFQPRLKQAQAKRSKIKQKISEIRAEAGRKGGKIKALAAKKASKEGDFASILPDFCQDFARNDGPSKTDFCQGDIPNESHSLVAKPKQSLANRIDKREEREEREENSYVHATAKSSSKTSRVPGFREGAEPRGTYGKVWLTESELAELKTKFPEQAVASKITHLDSCIENGQRKYTAYKNHAACIRNWLTSDRADGKFSRNGSGPKIKYSNFESNMQSLGMTEEEIEAAFGGKNED